MRLFATAAVLAWGFASAPAAEPAAAADPRAWKELDMVPMPKEIRLADKDLELNPDSVTLVTGEKPSRQSEIGADWINRRLTALGGRPLPVAKSVPPSGTALIIGTRYDNPLIERAAAAGAVSVGPGNPGERGYEIKRSADGRLIYLAGADDIGALYACVTLGELLEKKSDGIFWRAAEVRDWPDTIWIVPGCAYFGSASMPELSALYKEVKQGNPTEKQRAAYLSAVQSAYDQLLRRKFTLFEYPNLFSNGVPFVHNKGWDVIKEGVEYGKERGIEGMTFAVKPYAGLASRYPDAAKARVCPRSPGRDNLAEWIRCWSLDDLYRATARDLAGQVMASGLTHICFHDTDTGGFENPAQWEERCDECRKRWGDDYAAATINKHRIYFEEIKRLNPGARCHFTFYPYNMYILDSAGAEKTMAAKYGDTPAAKELAKKLRERYTDFWSRAHKAFPAGSVTFCAREDSPEAVKAFRDLTPERGMFAFFALMSRAWRPFFSEAAAWTGTFCGNTRDVLFPRYHDEFVPLEPLAVREYSWNRNTPGAKPWSSSPDESRWKNAEPQGEIFEIILPRLARNLFGREAGPQVAAAVSSNVDLQQIFNKQRPQLTWLRDSSAMRWQADNAAAGAKALDSLAPLSGKAGQTGMDDSMLRRLTALREQFHMGMGAARVRTQIFLARELALKGDMKGAGQALAKGADYLRDAESDRARLLRERPDDPVLKGKDSNAWAGGWRDFTADRADFSPFEKALEQTRASLNEIAAQEGLPKRVVEGLAKERFVRAHKISGSPGADGRLPEAEWSGATPVGPLIIPGGSVILAQASTRAKFMFDKDTLFARVSCLTPGGAEVQNSDSAEIFLQPPGEKADVFHFVIRADGRVRQQAVRLETADGVTRKVVDNGWTCPGLAHFVSLEKNRWDAELKIPLAPLTGAAGAKGWRVNICRVCPFGADTEASSVLPPGVRDFHDSASYPRIEWSDKSAPPLSVMIEAPDFKVGTETLPDTVATVVSFRLELESDRVITGVKIVAEAYDSQGAPQKRKELACPDRVIYRWTSKDTYGLEYTSVTPRGAVLLKLTCDEGSAERWLRFGGWDGSGSPGSVFAPGIDGSSGLAGECHFPDRTRLDGADVPLINSPAGTVEFWFKPSWMGFWLNPWSRWEPRAGTHTFAHYGPPRKDKPDAINGSPLAVQHDSVEGRITASLLPGGGAGGVCASASTRKSEEWLPGAWRHAALVWDASAGKADRVRLYIDGRRVAGASWVKGDGKGPETISGMIDNSKPFPIQIGSLNSGWRPSGAVIDSLRISRSARYNADFTPETKEPSLDNLTTARFLFNGSLDGDGMTSDGKVYQIQAVPGAPEW